MKNTGRKITMLTGYDFSMARIIDTAGIDVILGGRFSFECDGGT
jgi:3-methyl-2-oxobutanoate hydroxymethyltransferase